MDQISFRFKNQLITAFFCSLLAITTSILAEQISAIKAPMFEVPTFTPPKTACNVVIVIPAYNEENRIEKTLTSYFTYFHDCKNITAHFLVVCNNCSDKTVTICKKLQKTYNQLNFIDLKPGGKGFAIKQGFLKALEYKNIDYIGFVDADMATMPPYFYELICKIQGHDGAIASRYKKGARVWPNRPFLKEIGGKFYNWVLRHNFHLDIRDTQCGAKLFTYQTVAQIAPHMKETGWAFDLELLYLCQLFDKDIIEIATTWRDMPGSNLVISSCYKEFLSAPKRIKKQQQELAIELMHKKHKEQKQKYKEEQEKKKLHKNPPFMASTMATQGKN